MSPDEKPRSAPEPPTRSIRGRWGVAASFAGVAIALAVYGAGRLGSPGDRLAGPTPVESGTVGAGDAAPRIEPPAAPDSGLAEEGSPAPPDSIEAAEQELRAAWAEHDEARAALAAADAELAEVEREVEAMERYVEDLEQQGEDPAKHAFEAMERFDPVIERFQAASRMADDAEAAEAAAATRVRWAEAALENLRTQRGD